VIEDRRCGDQGSEPTSSASDMHAVDRQQTSHGCPVVCEHLRETFLFEYSPIGVRNLPLQRRIRSIPVDGLLRRRGFQAPLQRSHAATSGGLSPSGRTRRRTDNAERSFRLIRHPPVRWKENRGILTPATRANILSEPVWPVRNSAEWLQNPSPYHASSLTRRMMLSLAPSTDSLALPLYSAKSSGSA
jgi:hypothetical protein